MNSLRVIRVVFTALSLTICVSAFAGPVAFEEVWSLIEKNSPALIAAQQEIEASRLAQARAERHWYPRIYATGKAFSTNDPALSFISILEQRQIRADDFVPGALNEPGNNTFEQGTLRADLPLFEGGEKAATARSAEKTTQAKEWDKKAAVSGEYAGVASDYAALLALSEEEAQLQHLKAGVLAVMERYRIGSKSNPIGYSGLLGLKNLRNRVEGLGAEAEAQIQGKRRRILTAAKELSADWAPVPERAVAFLARVFPRTPAGPDEAGNPSAVMAAQTGAEALAAAKYAELARFLPKVGLFAQGDLYNGSRGTGTSYSGGAYLQWDLFVAPNFGAISQAGHSAQAAEARADELRERLADSRFASEASAAASARNLALLDESAQLLKEQTEVARNLFRNGSINALQLVEVLARRADLIVNRADAELALVAARSTLFVTSGGEGAVHGTR